MRNWIAATVISLFVANGWSAHALTLADKGSSGYCIAVPETAIPAERTAALELQTHLQQVTGVLLPILDEKDAMQKSKRIVVGLGEDLKTACPNVDWASLKHDGILCKTVGETLYLAGGQPRGTLYAVYTFLEDVVGCRWWTSTESYTPTAPKLEIPPLDIAYTPQLLYREAFYRDAFDGVFAARSKCNGHFERIAPEYGGHYSILGWCHTFYQLLPPDKYFGEHPEWYSEIDGKRVSDGAQLCLTNEEMRAELVKNALEWIRKDPSAGIISIAQNDCGGNCQCAACKAVETEEGAPSGLLIRFVNAVAEEIQKEFPDVLVETLAYQYTRQAPKLAQPRDNVIVRLCSIECCFSQPLGQSVQNAQFKQDIESWSAIAKQLYIWDYVTNFKQYLLPHPNIKTLASNIRLFLDNKAIGLFEQGDSGSSCGEFVELRAWLLAHLMWDPSRDPDALINEFLMGYYGPAAWPLRQYIDLMNDAVSRAQICLRCYMDDTASWLPLDGINEAARLFGEAQKAVENDPVLSQRVRRARLPLDYAWLNRYTALKRLARGQGKAFLGPADPAAACEDFIQTCESFNAGSYAEGRPFEQCAKALRARFRAPAPPPTECQGLAEDEWVDVQDNEFTLFQSGTWAESADDAQASDKHAARMPASHTQWAVQYPISADIAALGKAHCYLSARCEASASTGNAFQIGIYDAEEKVPVTQRMITTAESIGGYHAFDLGVCALSPGMYVWVAPLNNPNEISAVYVDRAFFVKEP